MDRTQGGRSAAVARRALVTENTIRAAAIRLFAERGYRATTMEDIARELEIRGPSLYKHVGSKQELLAQIMLTTMRTLIGLQQAAVRAGGGPTVQLRRAVEAHVRFHATHREEAFVGNRELGSLEEPTRSDVIGLRADYERGLRAIVADGVGSKEFSVPDARLASFAILDMGMGVSAWYRADGERDSDSLAYTYADLAVAMVGAVVAQDGDLPLAR